DLAETIVDLVRAGVIEVFALEIDLRAFELAGEVLGEIERIGTPDIVLQEPAELRLEFRIVLGLTVGAFQLQQQRHQSLGDIAAAERAEMPAQIRSQAEAVGPSVAHAAPGTCVY